MIRVVATLISWLWLNEVPTPFSLLGGSIVFCGVMLINRSQVETQSKSIDDASAKSGIVNQVMPIANGGDL